MDRLCTTVTILGGGIVPEHRHLTPTQSSSHTHHTSRTAVWVPASTRMQRLFTRSSTGSMDIGLTDGIRTEHRTQNKEGLMDKISFLYGVLECWIWSQVLLFNILNFRYWSQVLYCWSTEQIMELIAICMYLRGSVC